MPIDPNVYLIYVETFSSDMYSEGHYIPIAFNSQAIAQSYIDEMALMGQYESVSIKTFPIFGGFKKLG